MGTLVTDVKPDNLFKDAKGCYAAIDMIVQHVPRETPFGQTLTSNLLP